MNAWPVDMLQPRDVYVAGHFGLKVDGPSIGDNVGYAIYARSGNGIVYDGAVRDINGLEELQNFVSFVRSYDPSHHYGSLSSGSRLNSTMVSINAPTRIGHATAMPGDEVLGRNGGVLFIPPQLAEQVVKVNSGAAASRLFFKCPKIRICSTVYTDASELGRAEEPQQPAKAWHQFRYSIAGFSRSLAP